MKILFKPVRDAGDRTSIHWIIHPQGDLSKPIACISDLEMQEAVSQWINLHPEIMKIIKNSDENQR
jgi:hypothetical protein